MAASSSPPLYDDNYSQKKKMNPYYASVGSRGTNTEETVKSGVIRLYDRLSKILKIIL